MLAADGFNVQRDPDVDKIIRKDYYIGKFHDLEFEAKKYPNGFEIGFFQNVVYENPNGGRYDFDKFSKMPRMISVKRVAAFGLFDLTPGDKRGRVAPLRIPPEYAARKQAISQSATKELVAELRQRGFNVKIQ